MKRITFASLVKAGLITVIALLGVRELFTTRAAPANPPMSTQPRQKGIPQLTWVLIIVVVGLLIIWSAPGSVSAQNSFMLDGGGDVGYYSSLALDSSGIPVIAYYDRTNNDLKLAHCNNTTNCDDPFFVTIDTAGEPGWVGISLALTAGNIPVIAYVDASSSTLKLAICDTTLCGKPTLFTIDSPVNRRPSLQLTSTDIAVIAYGEATNQQVRVARCNSSTDCATPTIVNLGNIGGIKQYISLQLDSSDVAMVSYYTSDERFLRFAHCNTIACTSPISQILDNSYGAGLFEVMQLRGGNPVIVYYHSTAASVRLLTCDDPTCTTRTIEPLPSMTGFNFDYVLDSSGYPVIAEQANSDLVLVRCFTQHCAQPITSTLDGGAPIVGSYPSLVMDGSAPLVSYYDQTNGDLKLYNGRMNLAPILVNNNEQVVAIGGSMSLSQSALLSTDADNAPAASLVYTVMDTPVQGVLNLTRFTQAQINANQITYSHTGSGSDSFTFTVSDGIALLGPYTFNITAIAITFTATPTDTRTATNTTVPTNTHTPTPTWTETSAPPFQCNLLAVNNVRFSGNRVLFDMINQNVLATRVERTVLNWATIGDYPGMILAQMKAGIQAYWQGSDSTPPTDTSSDAGFISSAGRYVDGGDTETWEGTFINGPANLSDYWSTGVFASSTFYFDNPDSANDCVIILNGPPPMTYTPSVTFTPAPTYTSSITRTPTRTPGPTLTLTPTNTATRTPTRTPSPTATSTFTSTPVPPGVFRTLDIDGAGEFTSLELDGNIPVIAYIGNGNLRFIRCNNTPQCDNPVMRTLDTNASYAAMDLDVGGIPVIAYYDALDRNLKLARCGNATCDTVSIRTLDSVGDVGVWTAMALDTGGIPVIVYMDLTNGDMKLARCNNNTTCDLPTITVIENGDPYAQPGLYPSMVLDAGGRPIISYRAASLGLRLVFCNNNTDCNSPNLVMADSSSVFGFTSIRLDSAGRPVVSYQDGSNHLTLLLRCNLSTACNSPSIRVLDSEGGNYTSLALAAGDLPVVSYESAATQDLRLARCTTPTSVRHPVHQPYRATLRRPPQQPLSPQRALRP
ncbi:MAG: cadherin-like domain-containing protein [Anaerolineae bacterium]